MLKYAKDPIDFIRNFNFTKFVPNSGSTGGSTRTPKDLILTLTTLADNLNTNVREVHLTSNNSCAVKQVANWLSNDHNLKLYPYAAVTTMESCGREFDCIELVFANDSSYIEVLANELQYLIGRVSSIATAVDNGCATVILTKEERELANVDGLVCNHLTLGQRQQGSNRAPQLNQSRLPTKPTW